MTPQRPAATDSSRPFASRHFSRSYRTTLLGTSGPTVIFDLTVALQIGLALACVLFIYRIAQLFRIEPLAADADGPLLPGVQAFALYGALFFGAVDKVEAVQAQLEPGTRAVVLPLHQFIRSTPRASMR